MPRLFQFSSLALALLLSACGSADRIAQTAPSAQSSAQPPAESVALDAQRLARCPVPATVRQLARASDGLLYLSETDAPFSFLWLPAQRLPAPADLPALVGVTAASVETVPFAQFFQRLTAATDPADPQSVQNARRFARLRDTFKQAYGPLLVYRVQGAGNPAQIHIYILGRDRCGVSGLETLAVET